MGWVKITLFQKHGCVAYQMYADEHYFSLKVLPWDVLGSGQMTGEGYRMGQHFFALCMAAISVCVTAQSSYLYSLELNRSKYTPQPLYNTTVGVHTIKHVS